MNRRTTGVLTLTVALVAAACGSTGNDADDDSTVIVFGPYVGVDADRFAAVLDDFEAESGVDVTYTGSLDFVADLRQRSVGNQRPDVAVVPQPAVVDALIDADALAPLAPAPFDAVRSSFDPDDLAQLPWDPRYVVPYRANTKSLVWYRPDVFAEQGWAVPSTLEQLARLVDTVQRDGEMAPWCFSIFAGSATGWPATDWVEDVVLRRAGPEVYDRWAAGQLSWQDDAIRDAFDEFHDLVLADERAAGGTRAVLQTEVPRTSAPMFATPTGCAMYKQASFAEDWFPAGTEIGQNGDVDFFVLPGTTGGDTRLVAGGDAAVAFDDRAEVTALLAFLAGPDGGRAWAERGGFVSERIDVEVDDYYSDGDALFADLLRSETVTRFDASDTLPPEIGADLLWGLVTAWIAGEITLDELLESMDEALGIDAGDT